MHIATTSILPLIQEKIPWECLYFPAQDLKDRYPPQRLVAIERMLLRRWFQDMHCLKTFCFSYSLKTSPEDELQPMSAERFNKFYRYAYYTRPSGLKWILHKSFSEIDEPLQGWLAVPSKLLSFGEIPRPCDVEEKVWKIVEAVGSDDELDDSKP